MPNNQQQNISEESDHNEIEFTPQPNQGSSECEEKPNILNQGFILYSDDEIQSNSQQSLTQREQQSDISRLSRQSSCTSIENYEQNSQMSFLLRSLSQGNEESSVYNIHQSECSQSGLELLHQLEPLFKGKVFLRRSPRFAVYGGTTQPNVINDNDKPQILLDKNEDIDMMKKQIESQMIEDDKPTATQQISSSKIIEENYQTPTTSMFSNQMAGLNNHTILQPKQQQPQNSFIRFTRSSKKNIHQETQLSFSSTNKNSTLSLFNISNKQPMNDSEYISRVTKDFLVMNRKQKRIKKYQQKQGHSSFTLKSLRKRQSSFQRPSN